MPTDMSTPAGAIINDSDSSIRYSDGWVANMSVSVGPNGQIPLYNSLHITQRNADFSFSFNGSFISVMGLMLPSGQLPKWECYIDGVKLLSLPLTDGQEHLPLCSQSLGDGHHTLTVAVNATQDNPLCFDYIQYHPSSSGYTDDMDKVFNPETAVVKAGDWPSIPSISSGIMTREKDSKLQIQFNGVSMTWLGLYDNNLSGPPTTATYTINGSNPIPFPVNNFASNFTPTIFDQIILQTNDYPHGLHNLEITYNGDSNNAPLTLTSFIVQNVTQPLSTLSNMNTTSSSTMSPNPMTTSSSTAPNHHRPRSTGSIIGAVFGALLLIVIFLLCLLFWRKRNSTKRVGLPESSGAIRPFNFTYYPTVSRNASSPPVNSKASRAFPTDGSVRGALPSEKIQRMNNGRTSTSRLQLSSAVTSVPSTQSSPEIRVHHDSGLRISQPEDAHVIDVPPIYSPV
ncbi:hypothetical protein JR316_0004002 [Psilocybe cubensis]|uniref:Uncharacterized protein n=2 Tax=Psilocybe cubensis TaxID=181762 RepID=A0A8H8CPB6_PSICU|nr:hypothetical protein JR316_0004002 [Psilocybe cubensis]KAH9484520.1 hypothetical protein JR316_0004002 [Psilocybe cubensis]